MSLNITEIIDRKSWSCICCIVRCLIATLAGCDSKIRLGCLNCCYYSCLNCLNFRFLLCACLLCSLNGCLYYSLNRSALLCTCLLLCLLLCRCLCLLRCLFQFLLLCCCLLRSLANDLLPVFLIKKPPSLICKLYGSSTAFLCTTRLYAVGYISKPTTRTAQTDFESR